MLGNLNGVRSAVGQHDSRVQHTGARVRQRLARDLLPRPRLEEGILDRRILDRQSARKSSARRSAFVTGIAPPCDRRHRKDIGMAIASIRFSNRLQGHDATGCKLRFSLPTVCYLDSARTNVPQPPSRIVLSVFICAWAFVVENGLPRRLHETAALAGPFALAGVLLAG